MEASAFYGSSPVRPRLTVVKDGGASYSALPHAVLFDPRLTRGEIVLYAVLQSHTWQSGECFASHATLAAEMRVSERMLRNYLDRLIETEYVIETPAGPRRSKSYRLAPIGNTVPIERASEKQVSDWEPANRKHSSAQSETQFRANRKRVSDSYKKTPEKKNKKKTDTAPTEPAAREPTKSGRLLDLLKAADIDVTMRPQDHRALKDSGAAPELVAEAYAAIFRGEWGDDFMRRSLSVQFVIGRLAGFASWKREQMGDLPRPHVNGTAAQVTPATDDDRASWIRALGFLAELVNGVNFETYLRPLEVAGRMPDGGLCLVVPSGVPAEGVARFRDGIRRALLDAGDPAPMAVAFKARRSTGAPTHAG